MYCTAVQLADSRLTRELSQIATPERVAILDDSLMEATLRGTDRASFDPVLVSIADEALVHVEKALADADGVIDGYLRSRKPTPYTVPLDPVPDVVSVWARWIARYLMHKDRVHTTDQQDPIVRDYKEALRFLQLVADGKFSLGPLDPLPPAGAGIAQVCAPERVFTQESLRDYGT